MAGGHPGISHPQPNRPPPPPPLRILKYYVQFYMGYIVTKYSTSVLVAEHVTPVVVFIKWVWLSIPSSNQKSCMKP